MNKHIYKLPKKGLTLSQITHFYLLTKKADVVPKHLQRDRKDANTKSCVMLRDS
ncbi:hypothetical protein A6R68_21970, partial [Neotoma lepida]